RPAQPYAGAMERREPAGADPHRARMAQRGQATVRLQPGERGHGVPGGRDPDAQPAVSPGRGERLQRGRHLPPGPAGRVLDEAAVIRRRSARGFTLLELLVAVALLSVLAVLTWRGMDSVLRGRDRIVSTSEDLRSLTVALTQMEEDLRRSWPIRLLGLPEPPVSFSIGGDRAPPSLGLLRETRGSDAVQVQRVVY